MTANGSHDAEATFLHLELPWVLRIAGGKGSALPTQVPHTLCRDADLYHSVPTYGNPH